MKFVSLLLGAFAASAMAAAPNAAAAPAAAAAKPAAVKPAAAAAKPAAAKPIAAAKPVAAKPEAKAAAPGTKNACDAQCLSFGQTLLSLSTYAAPVPHADAHLCNSLQGHEFQAACHSYTRVNGGLLNVAPVMANEPDHVCAHLETCQKAIMDAVQPTTVSPQTLSLIGEQASVHQKAKAAAHAAFDSSLLKLHTQAMQALTAMSEAQLQSNALAMHQMTMQHSLDAGEHDFSCVDPDDVSCATNAELFGMHYMMATNTLPSAGLKNGGFGLSALSTVFGNQHPGLSPWSPYGY